jgi:DNA-binding transcriptional MerR regulator
MSGTIPGALRIGQVATLAGLSRRTVRHYEQQGLLAKPERTTSGYRRFTMADVAQLTRIRRLRELGLSVPQIRDALARDAAPVALREALLRLDADLAGRVEALQRLRDQVRDLLTSEAGDLTAAPAWRELLRQARQKEAAPSETGAQALPRGAVKLENLVEHAEAIGGAALVHDLMGRLKDPDARARFGALIRRLKALAHVPPERLETEIESLARALAGALPVQLLPGPLAEPAMMTILLGEFPDPAQVRCLERAWRLAHALSQEKGTSRAGHESIGFSQDS